MSTSNFDMQMLFQRFASSEEGISSKEAAKKKETFGKNVLPEKEKNRLQMFLKEFADPLVFVLFAALGISLGMEYFQEGHVALSESVDAIAIFGIIVLNAGFGFFQELKAEKSMKDLKNLQAENASVLRDGKKKLIASEDLVPGDIVFLGEGEKIPADIRLLEAVECRVQESMLTGESDSVEKDANWKGVAESIGDQKNMMFSGTELLSGRAKGLVVATGLFTEIGKIANMLAQVQSPKTPLEKRLEVLSKNIAKAVFGICVVLFLIALLQNFSVFDALFSSIALAVGAIPEGLPAVMTISLAIGVSAMANQKALVRELRSVETLGSVTVIASDKTGTITENKMHVEEIFWKGNFFDKENFFKVEDERLFEILQNCNDAELPNIGDPTEIGLLELSVQKRAKIFERIGEIPFSSATKWMSTTHEVEGEKILFYKGAAEILSQFFSEEEEKQAREGAEILAKKGFRTIALGEKREEETTVRFVGLVALSDPPRKSVKTAIETAKNAGIRTIMITGDHPTTAQSIGKRVGIESEVLTGVDLEKISDEELQETVKKISIFARVAPVHKVRICKALQANGEVVAMTGDGVNDAPAISQADVGISMGKVGTSVARSASDMILLDDDYTTIVQGVAEGRRIFRNIKTSVLFLLSTNLAEVVLLFGSVLFGFPMALLPIHILFLNLLTDSLPALALASDPEMENSMQKKPRPIAESFLHNRISIIAFLGILAGISTLVVFAIAVAQGVSTEQAQTLSFFTLAFLELFLIFSIRKGHRLFQKFSDIVTFFTEEKNPWVFRSVLFSAFLVLLSIFSPLKNVLSLEMFPVSSLCIAIGVIILVFFLAEMRKK